MGNQEKHQVNSHRNAGDDRMCIKGIKTYARQKILHLVDNGMAPTCSPKMNENKCPYRDVEFLLLPVLKLERIHTFAGE